MAQTVSNYDAALKEYYLPPITNAFPALVELWDEFEKTTEGWTGNKIINPVKVSRNKGIGARADGGKMPAAGRQGLVEHQVTAKYNYARIELTGPVMAASENNKGAFAKALTYEIQGATEDLTNDVDRQLGGDGTGTLATVETGATSATQDVKYAGASSGAISGEPGTRFLEADMAVRVGTTAQITAGTADNVVVSSITDDGRLVFTASFTSVTNDLIVWGDANDHAYNSEIEGIPAAMITTGSYQNINVGTYPKFKAQVYGNSGTNRTLTEKLMQQVIDAIHTAGGEVDLILAHTSMKLEFLEMMWGNKRYIGPSMADAGFIPKGKNRNELDFNGTRFRFIRNFPYNKIAFLTRNTWSLGLQKGGVHWSEEGGSILSKVSGYDSYEALLRLYSNLFCMHPGKNGYLTDITVSLVSGN